MKNRKIKPIRKLIKEPDLDEPRVEVKLETISNRQDLLIPDCCRELWESCEHLLPKEEKREYNPI